MTNTTDVEILDIDKDYGTKWFQCVQCKWGWFKDRSEYYYVNKDRFNNLKPNQQKIQSIICPHHQLEGKYWKLKNQQKYYYGTLDEYHLGGFEISDSKIETLFTCIDSFVSDGWMKRIEEISEKEFENIIKQKIIEDTEEELKAAIWRQNYPQFENMMNSILIRFRELYHTTKIIGTDIVF